MRNGSVSTIALPILGVNAVQPTVRSNFISKVVNILPCKGFVKNVQTSCRISFPRVTSESKSTVSSNLSNKKMVPDSDPPSSEDVNRLYDFFEKSSRVVVLTGAGMSTECGIPDYRSPNGAYSTGFKPITHQVI